MKIEEGKFYRRADGSELGPARRIDYHATYPWAVGGHYFTDDGRFYEDQESSRYDLIEEIDPQRESSMKATVAFIEQLEDQKADAIVAGERMTKTKLLDAAKATVADRGVAYGGVEDNFARIARLWQTHFLNKAGAVVEITPDDVAQMMVLMKVARLENQPNHLDSWTDIAGYAACGAEITQDLPKVRKLA